MKEKCYKKVSFWIKLLICVFCIPILFINSVIIIDSLLHPNEIPDFFGYKPFIVLSSSMEPTISAGDIAIVKKTDVKSLKVDDIITFQNSDGTIITHRIVDIQTEDGKIYFVTKGDSNNIEDQGLVDFNLVEGKYLFKLAGLGNVAMYLQSPFGFITVLMVFFVIFLIYQSIISARISKQQEEEKKELRAEIEKLKCEKKNQKNKSGV